MSESPYLSKIHPGLAGGRILIPAADAGVALVKTGLKDIRAVTATIVTDALIAAEEGLIAVQFGSADGLDRDQVRIVVQKTGGAPADSDVTVSFLALGDR